YEIEIDLVATSNVFLAGHRIAVEISSSNFPQFDRNPNHGGVIEQATEPDFVVAAQSLFHDASRPSFVTLPVVSGWIERRVRRRSAIAPGTLRPCSGRFPRGERSKTQRRRSHRLFARESCP